MKDRYESPLCSRYSSERMQRLFSADTRFSTWRRLWVDRLSPFLRARRNI